MKELIRKKEIKGILVSVLLIVLSIFLILKPEEMISTLLKVIGIFVLIAGAFDFVNYFLNKDETKLFDYGLFKGIMEITIGVLFIFKYETLISIFPMILGLLIIFINVFKLQLSLNLKMVDENRYLLGVIISSLSIILGIVILLNPFESLKIVVIVSGSILLVSELSNIIYSFMILKNIKKDNKVVRDIIEGEQK